MKWDFEMYATVEGDSDVKFRDIRIKPAPYKLVKAKPWNRTAKRTKIEERWPRLGVTLHFLQAVVI